MALKKRPAPAQPAAAAPRPSLDALRVQAQAAEAAQDWAGALAIWTDMRKHHPLDRSGWIGGAMAQARSGNINAALALIDDAAKRFPRDAPVIAARGYIVEFRNDPAASAAAWQSVRAKIPQAPDGWVRGAQLLAKAGKRAAALAMLDDAAKRLPDSWLVLVTRGHIVTEAGDPKETTEAWAAVRRMAPDVADGYVHGALAALRADDVAAAAAILDAGLARLPDNIGIRAAHARLAEHQGRWRAALERWVHVLQMNPTHEGGVAGRARAAAKIG